MHAPVAHITLQTGSQACWHTSVVLFHERCSTYARKEGTDGTACRLCCRDGSLCSVMRIVLQMLAGRRWNVAIHDAYIHTYIHTLEYKSCRQRRSHPNVSSTPHESCCICFHASTNSHTHQLVLAPHSQQCSRCVPECVHARLAWLQHSTHNLRSM